MTPQPPPCGCRLVSPFGDRTLGAIDYCPLHLAAERLRDALEAAIKRIDPNASYAHPFIENTEAILRETARGKLLGGTR